jgi:hypothetical protein
VNRLRTSAAGGLIVLLAACTSSPSSEPPRSEPPSPISSPRGAPTLAATLPRELGGMELPVFSMRGAEFVASADADPELLSFLDRLNADLEEVSVAFGFLVEPQIDLLTMRVEGITEQRLSREFRAAHAGGDAPEMEWRRDSTAGKQVLVADAADPAQGSYYLYVRGDTLYLVATPHQELAEEAVAGLP